MMFCCIYTNISVKYLVINYGKSHYIIVKMSKFRSAGHSRHIRKNFSLLLASIRVFHELVTNVKSEIRKAHMYRLRVKL